MDLAETISTFELGSIGREPVAKAKACLLDFLSCTFEARDLAWSRQARSVAAGGGKSHILGTDETATPGDAAFANGVMGHGLVREDMHAASISHHGVVVWPTLIALAERKGVSGAQLLAAAIVGYEVGCRIGRVLFDKDLARLFRPTGLTAPIGAAAAGSRMLGLDRPRIASALALGANAAGGLNQWPWSGGSDMYFHPGHAARGAVTAVLLAEQDAYGSPDIFEGEAGLFAAYARRKAPAGIELFPNGEADIMNVYSKPAPACNFAQTACQAALRLSRELGPEVSARRIIIHVPEAAALYPGCDFAGPFERPLQAKMSIQFGVASTLARQDLSEANFADLDDPDIMRLVAACELKSTPELTAAFPAKQGAEVEAVLDSGRRVKLSQTDVIPATEAEIRARFRDAAAAILGPRRAEEIEDFVDRLEKSGDAGRLARLASLRRGAQPQAA
jgi:2-methylcitrate dehydratase PrpD